MTPENDVLEGDCVEVMASVDAESVDAIVTDPPYDLVSGNARYDLALTSAGSSRERRPKGPRGGFMGKTWDGTGVAFRPDTWAAALRAAKPGAHLLAFGGTRTYHRMAAAIEDAGWEIRDCLVWAYASGFPKSLNFPDGWGTALKPAWEPIVMARKPLRGTVAANREAHGTGALNIDGTRIGTAPRTTHTDGNHRLSTTPGWGMATGDLPTPSARWPANVILTDPIFDGGVDGVVGGGQTDVAWTAPSEDGDYDGTSWKVTKGAGYRPAVYGDSGTYSRFFLIPKADRADREPVLGGLPMGEARHAYGNGLNTATKLVTAAQIEAGTVERAKRQNVHPTVKPTELMRHLVRLVTPPGGLVLDPFLGSGTTALAAEMEGFRWLGIEKEPEYVAIARARLLGTQRGLGLSA